MRLREHRTKIVATLGPASDAQETIEAMIEAGMTVARLNFSHGDEAYHSMLVERVRAASTRLGRRVAIMGDLPGPKMRIGEFSTETVELERDDEFVLTTEEIVGDRRCVSISFGELPGVVTPDDQLFLNDGFILLRVVEVSGPRIRCRVQVGGELSARKGLNLPGINLGISAFTEDDHDWVRFAARHRIDALSQSFVASAGDLERVRVAARTLDYAPFIIAKIERADALDQLGPILAAADGIMVARGDLGVEIPIERIAVEQKRITELANRAGKPVITATQMLESMVHSRRPTRAEATDVANAILGGSDCVMLSGESAVGRYPVESVAMLAAIAAQVEPERGRQHFMPDNIVPAGRDEVRAVDLIAASVYHTIKNSDPAAVIVPTRSGNTPRNVARFRLPQWIIAFSPDSATCQALQFSYGIHAIQADADRSDWSGFARDWLREHGVGQGLALLAQGPTEENPCGNFRMEILELGPERANCGC